MAFSPLAKYRNFTSENLRSLIELYPDLAEKQKWSDVANSINDEKDDYKQTAYQQACQFGIEDRSGEYFRIKNYLYYLDDEELDRYIRFWFKIYYAPNPYVKSSDSPVLIYCAFAKRILDSSDHKINYEECFVDFFGDSNRKDILLNLFKNYCDKIEFEISSEKKYLYIKEENIDAIRNEVLFIENEYPIINANDRTTFFDRFSYANYSKFYNISRHRTFKNCLQIKRSKRQDNKHSLNLIIYGAPGTGKTYSTAEYALAIIENREVDENRKTDDERRTVLEKYNDFVRKGQIVFTTFHQSYGYEEFVQGLRPDTSSDRLRFDIIDGVFKRIADRALNDLENNYVIIIDEINRGNISRVFGELISLIEDDKRWGEVDQLCATLQSGDVFAVPNNLYIIGTMNSADKSISLIDSALRRRFDFIEKKPSKELIDDSELSAVFEALNKKLEADNKSTDLLIGHSYFMNKKIDDLPNILNQNVIPLLYEYYYDDRNKVEKALEEGIEGTGVSLIKTDMGRLSVKRNG